MDIKNQGPVKAAGEREVDITVVQMLETSGNIRQWFVNQLSSDLQIDSYLGSIMHASYAGQGESDVEFGFRTETGDRHVVLIEDKIDASKQPDQIERYFKRGRYRINHGDWDSFTVCLLAPDRYVSQEDIAKFDSVLSYEEVMDYLDEHPHDSAKFFLGVFQSAMQRRDTDTTDVSDTLWAIAEQFEAASKIPHFKRSVKKKKRMGFKSTHPTHPDSVQYDIYIDKPGDTGRTNVRLQIAGGEGVTNEEREAIKSIVADNLELLSDYEWRPDLKKNIADTKVIHEEAIQNPEYDTYIDAIAEELRALTETFHPVFVRNSIK